MINLFCDFFFIQLISNQYNCGIDIVEVIPYVITWDGITTKCHKTYRRKLEIDKHVEAYIQSLTLKKTLESITLDMWSTVDDFRASREEKVCDALKVVYKVDDDAEEGEVKGFD
ncbi:hypothetical protein BDAP_002659 [Binucleata daphniae]